MAIIPVILAGGYGRRLWPLSQKSKPKQFIKLAGQYTLLQQTLRRLQGLSGVASPIVICNSEHYEIVKKQLTEIGVAEAQIILESVGRGTAPAIAIAALQLISQGEDPLLLVLPADHMIIDIAAFHRAVELAQAYASRNFLVGFGITPLRPETGYGYIELGEHLDNMGGYSITRFIEKPTLEFAKLYMASGTHLWNSGIFMLRASVYLQELQQYAADIYQVCTAVATNIIRDGQQLLIDREKFSSCRSDSIDYAIMEKTKIAVAIPLSCGWNDLGSWHTLWDLGNKDSAGNVISGAVQVSGVKNSYIKATKRKVVALGITNCVIVETAEAVLVMTQDQCQDVRLFTNSLDPEHE